MKSIFKAVCLSVLFTGAVSAELPHESLKYPELKFQIPDVAKEKLPNGLTLFHIKDSSLPIIRMSLYVKGGSHRENRKNVGLSDLMSSVQRSGGTKNTKVEKLNEFLERLGATIGASSSAMYNTVSMKCLSGDFDKVMPHFFDVAMAPAFDESRFQLDKKNTIDALKRRDDDPGKLAMRKLMEKVYPNHPKGYEETIETVTSITRDDLIKSHKRRFQPKGAQLLVVGDIDLATLKQKINNRAIQWRQTDNSISKWPEMGLEFNGENFFVQRAIPQFKIRMAHKAIKIDNPDFAALRVMNYILGGGGFNSRMAADIRTARGLTYSVYSYIFGDKYYGMFGVGCDTKTEKTVEAVKAILDHIKKIRDQKVTEKEIKLAKESLINSFVFKFVTKHQVASRLLYYEQRDLPMDFLQTYLENLKKVSIEDIQRVAKEYLKPEKLKMVLVGDYAKIKGDLEKNFGNFEEIVVK
jgi:zinc protease